MPKKSKFTEEQIIHALREVDAGAKVQDIVRRLGVTETTFPPVSDASSAERPV